MNGPFIDVVELHDGATTRILRARDAQTNTSVVLKNILPDQHTAAEVARLGHEYDILRLLPDVHGVVRVLGMAEHEGTPALVLADRGGQSLAGLLPDVPLRLAQTLDWAVQIAGAIERIHAHRVVHKDINPSNIVIAEEGQDVELIDFELATTLPRVVETDVRTDVLEGTLAYIAPEQTGRTNRSIDHRADLYSFGATLYRMLTGRPPFVETDPLDLVHAHIARRPLAPVQLHPKTPAVVSAIVMKLLAKMPEDRYQSAAGVRADLEECLGRLTDDETIAPFELGSDDISDRFRLPERLIGREQEMARLETIFQRAAAGNAEVILIQGAAGIGKSALLREFARSVREGAGRCAKCQFLPRDADKPYAGLAAAFAPLVHDECARGDSALANMRSQLRTALGQAAAVVTELLPEVRILLGFDPPKLLELPADQTRERAKFAFAQFVQVFARDRLVLFLDDLPWADAASLKLLGHLFAENRERGLVIVASALEETPRNPRIAEFVEMLAEKGASCTTITLEPLDEEAVRAIVSEAVDAERGGISEREVAALAHLVHQRTLGNPLLVTTFLTSLHRDGALDFDHAAREWTWDMDKIEQASIPQDVAQVLSERARKLPPNGLKILHAAACIGSSFDRRLLETITNAPADEIRHALVEAAYEGLIWASANAFSFVHERVREAVLDSMPSEAQKSMHLRIGRAMLPHVDGDKLFFMLAHINAAADLITRADERLDFARLNLEAGRAARSQAALEAARTYFEAGLSFLPSNAWDTVRKVTLELFLGAAETAYSCNQRARAERLYQDLERQMQTDVERLRVASARVRMHRVLNEFGTAKTLALETLDKFGLSLPKKANIGRVLFEFGMAERKMAARLPEELLGLPLAAASETNHLLAALIEDTLFVVYFEEPLLHSVMTSRMIARMLSEGLSPVSPACFAAYALLVRLIRGQAERADALCDVAMRMCAKFPGLPTSFVRYVHAMLIMPFRRPFRHSMAALAAVYQAAKEEGSRVFMHLGLSPYVGYQWNAGVPIPEFLASLEARQHELDELAYVTNNPRSHLLLGRIALFMQGKTIPGTFATPDLDDATFVADIERDPMKLTAPLYDFNKAWAYLVLGEHGKAKTHWDCVPKSIEQPLSAVYSIGEFCWLRGMVQATNMPTNAILRAKAILSMRADQRKLEAYAAESPESFAHLAELLAAEVARVQGQDLAATDLYEKAAHHARSHGFVQYEAYASERTALLWEQRHNEEISRAYWQRAYLAYQRWGASAKETALETKHPWLKRKQQRLAKQTVDGTRKGTTSDQNFALDGHSMVLASQALSEEIALDKLVHKVMTVTAHATGATREALVLQDDARFVRVANFTAEGGAKVLIEPEVLDSVRDLPISLIHYVLRSGKPLLVDHAAEDDETRDDPYIHARNTKSLMIVPIVRHGSARGALLLENDELAGAFTTERLALCEVVMAQLSISVDNARLYANQERLIEERTRALEEAQAQLVDLEKNTTESRMAGGFAHEMRNVLTAAKMLLAAVHFQREGGEARSLCLENGESLFDIYRVLEGQIEPKVLDEIVPALRQLNANEEKLHNVLGMVGETIERALGTTATILEYSKIYGQRAGTTLTEFRYLVDALRQESGADFEKNGILFEVTMPPNATLRGNDVHWYSILKNLVQNARDALLDVDRAEGRKIHVRFDERRDNVQISVADNGPGISPEIADRMFDPFVSTKPNSGTGLGLGVVRKLVGLYQGTIDFESNAGQGTRFVISLPRDDKMPSHTSDGSDMLGE